MTLTVYCRFQVSFAVFQEHLVGQYKNALVFFIHIYQSCRRFKPLLWAFVVTCDVASSRLLSHSPRASAASDRSRRFRSSSPEEQRGQREVFRVYRKGPFDGWTVATSGNVSWINYDGDSAETSFHIRGRDQASRFFSFLFFPQSSCREDADRRKDLNWYEWKPFGSLPHLALRAALCSPFKAGRGDQKTTGAQGCDGFLCSAQVTMFVMARERRERRSVGGHGNMHYDAEALEAR